MYSKIDKDFDSEVAHWRVCLRLLCKPIPDMDIQAYFIKTTVYRANLNQRLEEAIPGSKFLFLYRDVSVCVRSVYKISTGLPFVQQIFFFETHFPPMRGLLLKRTARGGLYDFPKGVYDIYKQSKNLKLMYFHILFSHFIHVFFQQRKEHKNFPAVKYEHLISNPVKSMEAILEYCELNKDLVGPSLKSLEKDSQANSAISKSKLSASPSAHVDDSIRKDIKGIFREFGIPNLWENSLIENTITQE
jgi:hypothetical protein